MLFLTIEGVELWDEVNEVFIYPKTTTLQLEHSLVSLSKWESIWCKSFISSKDLTVEESISYIKCMTITQNVDPNIYKCITNKNIKEVREYINAPMTATYISNEKTTGGPKETITSELIYYWMISLNIPVEFQKWHLNRLLTLIKVCDRKNQPPKKMGRQELMSRNRALNAARKKKLNTKG